jgi:hypothetical protein
MRRLAAMHDDARRVLATLVRIAKPDASAANDGRLVLHHGPLHRLGELRHSSFTGSICCSSQASGKAKHGGNVDDLPVLSIQEMFGCCLSSSKHRGKVGCDGAVPLVQRKFLGQSTGHNSMSCDQNVEPA